MLVYTGFRKFLTKWCLSDDLTREKRGDPWLLGGRITEAENKEQRGASRYKGLEAEECFVDPTFKFPRVGEDEIGRGQFREMADRKRLCCVPRAARVAFF